MINKHCPTPQDSEDISTSLPPQSHAACMINQENLSKEISEVPISHILTFSPVTFYKVILEVLELFWGIVVAAALLGHGGILAE